MSGCMSHHLEVVDASAPATSSASTDVSSSAVPSERREVAIATAATPDIALLQASHKSGGGVDAACERYCSLDPLDHYTASTNNNARSTLEAHGGGGVARDMIVFKADNQVQLPRPAEKAYRRRRRRCTAGTTTAGLVSTSILLINTTGKACASNTAATAAVLQVLPPTAAIVTTASSNTATQQQRQRTAPRRQQLAFVPAAGILDVSWCRSSAEASLHGMPSASVARAISRRCATVICGSGSDRSGTFVSVARRATRATGTARGGESRGRSHVSPRPHMISAAAAAGATGDTFSPGRDDQWSLRGAGQPQKPPAGAGATAGPGAKPKRRVGRPSKKDIEERRNVLNSNNSASEMASTTVAAGEVELGARGVAKKAAAGVDGSSEDASTAEVFSLDSVASSAWTPKREGQGSWDKWQAKAKELEPPVWEMDLARSLSVGDVTMSQPLGLDLAECKGGVCVSMVHPGGSAERQGLRPGDRVVATSATLGTAVWEQNTVDGIMSAVGTRLVFSDTVTLRVERPLEPRQLANTRFRESVTQTYEVTLEKPPGLILEQVMNPQTREPVGVFVKGLSPGSPAERSGAVECGDRVVAVTGSIGNQMWPHRQLEGVVSAIDTRMGNAVTLRLERVMEMGAWTDPSSVAVDDESIDKTMLNYRETVAAGYGTTLRHYNGVSTATAEPRAPPIPHTPSAVEVAASAAAAAATSAGFDVNGVEAAAAAPGDKGNEEARTIVLERCATLVRSYGLRKQSIAVDSLLERMEKSGVQMNARFLNSALVAYLLCKAPQKAVDTFHAVTGIVWPELEPWPTLKRSALRPNSKGDAAHGAVTATATATAGNRQNGHHEQPHPVPRPPSIESAKVGGNNGLPAVNGGGMFAGGESVGPALERVSTATRRSGAASQKFPEEFLALKAGPPRVPVGAADDADDEDAVGVYAQPTSVWGSPETGKFLQMREVETPASGHHSATVKRPALGSYVGTCRPNALLVSTLVKAHGRRRRVDDAVRVVLKMPDWGLKPDVAVFNSLAAAAVWNRRMDLALEVVLGGVMQAWGVQPDQLSYNTLMDAFAREGKVRSVAKIFRFMQDEGIEPDVVTTTTLVKAQVAGGDMKGAVSTLIQMLKTSKLRDQLDAFPFNTVIQGLMKKLQWERAMEIFESMKYHGAKPDLITFNSLMSGLVRSNRPELAIEVFGEIESNKLTPDGYSYSSLISAYAKTGDVEAAVMTITTMTNAGVKPNLFTCSAAMQACIKTGQPDTALQVYETLITNGGMKADEVVNTLVVQAYGMLGDFTAAFDILTEMGKSKQDSKVPFNHLIKECVLAGEWSKATEAVKRMLYHGGGGKGIRFDYNTFNAVSVLICKPVGEDWRLRLSPSSSFFFSSGVQVPI